MATSVEPTSDLEASDDNLDGLSDAFGALADAAVDVIAPDEDASLESELAAGDETAPVEPPAALASTAGAGSPAVDASAATEPADPLASAKPFTYTVNGVEKAYDGIKVLANADGSLQGAIIPPDAIKDVQYRLQRQEYLETQNKALYERVQDADRIAFTAADGKDYTGLDAVQQMATEHAKLVAAFKVLDATLSDPDKLGQLAVATLKGDTSEMQRLRRDLTVEAKDAAIQAKESWTQRLHSSRAQASEASTRQESTRQAITSAVQQWAAQFPALTPEDVQRVQAHCEKVGTTIVRPATPDEASQAGVKPGDLVIDHQIIHELLADRATLRSQQAESAARLTKNAQDAASENARRLAAAAAGKPKAGARPSVSSSKATKPKAQDEESEESWQQQRDRLMAGQFSASDDE